MWALEKFVGFELAGGDNADGFGTGMTTKMGFEEGCRQQILLKFSSPIPPVSIALSWSRLIRRMDERE
jgi:hypothetical protein